MYRHIGPAPGEHFLAIWFVLAEPDRGHASAFEAERKTADAAE
jgi:hypothetical protein